MMNHMLQDHIGKNVEVYVDDIIVKSLGAEQYAKDLEQILGTLDRYKIKLNSDKCIRSEGRKIPGVHDLT